MLRVIGDIHDEIDVYLKLIADCNQSLQLGDFAREFGFLNGVSPKHKFFGGNHDHYPNMMAWSGGHHLGHFGSVEFDDFGAIFFVRGGSSVDASCRCIGRNWWAEEQLSWAQALEAVKCYQAVKPDILISHECPSNIVPYVTDPAFMERFHLGNSCPATLTGSLLEELHRIHKPDVHVFGHYHVSFDQMIGGTRYICIPPGTAVDFVRSQGKVCLASELS